MPAVGISILLVTKENIGSLGRVDDDVFDNPVQAELLTQFVAQPTSHLVVAVAREALGSFLEYFTIGMGSAISYVHPDKPLQLFINEVAVADRYQRQGVGKRLIEFMLEHGRSLGCTEAWVATEVSNAPARALYTATGGKEDKERAVVYTYPLVEGS